MTTQVKIVRDEDTLARIGEVGLEHRIRPIVDRETGLASALFAVVDEIVRRYRALARFEASFEATNPALLARNDERIFARERSRRRRQLGLLERERDRLLLDYGRELASSCQDHPALAEFA